MESNNVIDSMDMLQFCSKIMRADRGVIKPLNGQMYNINIEENEDSYTFVRYILTTYDAVKNPNGHYKITASFDKGYNHLRLVFFLFIDEFSGNKIISTSSQSYVIVSFHEGTSKFQMEQSLSIRKPVEDINMLFVTGSDEMALIVPKKLETVAPEIFTFFGKPGKHTKQVMETVQYIKSKKPSSQRHTRKGGKKNRKTIRRK